jgi:hypothetical protein
MYTLHFTNKPLGKGETMKETIHSNAPQTQGGSSEFDFGKKKIMLSSSMGFGKSAS